ncbi:hypothetical protein ENUP19_0126G0045 [Entamoeba nuttalli]|uniref:Uncharacterized protein n=1 Tax=Entamoeba nuttalli TaxID=412467 RepID=A0ABQ0DJF0_9EUKA
MKLATVLFQELTQQSENLINEPLVNGVVPQIISVNKNYETHEMNGHLQLKEFNEELETQHTHETKYPSNVLTNTNQPTTAQIVTTNILNTNKDGIYEELPKVGINNQINTSRIIDGTLLVSDLNSPIVTTSIDSSMMKKTKKNGENTTESPHLIPIVESGLGIGSETQISQNQIPSIRQAEQINLNDQINVSDIGGNSQVPINPKLIEMNMNGIPLGIHSLTGVIDDPNTIQTIEVPLQEINVKPNEKEGVGIKEEEENGAVIEIAL